MIIDGRSILTVYQPIGAYTPQQRADKITERIIAAAQDLDILPESVGLVPRDAWTEIIAGSRLLMAVTDLDAKMAGKSRKQLASEDAGNIRQALLNYRREHSWNAVLRGKYLHTRGDRDPCAAGMDFQKGPARRQLPPWDVD